MPSVWSNVKESFEFPEREQADQKMYELHKSGIIGWPHVIERIEAALAAAGKGD